MFERIKVAPRTSSQGLKASRKRGLTDSWWAKSTQSTQRSVAFVNIVYGNRIYNKTHEFVTFANVVDCNQVHKTLRDVGEQG